MDSSLEMLSQLDLDSSLEMLSVSTDAPPPAADDDANNDELPF